MAEVDDYKDEAEGPRRTAPQSPYTMRQVSIGVGILAIGLVVAFLVPIVLL